MLRFIPDGWLEGLARPLLMADPNAGLYFESSAPDFRFAMLLALLPVVMMAPHWRARFSGPARLLAIGLLGSMLIWTFAIGNGRYFLWGLVLVGPLLVASFAAMPGSRNLKLAVLLIALAVQATSLWMTYSRNAWAIGIVRDRPLAIDAHPLRQSPAVFLTLTSISYSLLIPHFHPESRWANLAGQRSIVPGLPEFERVMSMLQSPLPQYLVAPVLSESSDPKGQPQDTVRGMMNTVLIRYGLTIDKSRACELFRVRFASPKGGLLSADTPLSTEFWACPTTPAGPSEIQAAAAAQRHRHRFASTFEAVERHCPRWFVAAEAQDSAMDGAPARYYLSSDTRVAISSNSEVYVKYFRAFSPTFIGTVEQIAQGRIELDCRKLAGRYQPPWDRDLGRKAP